MTRMGERVGTIMTKTKSLPAMILISFVLGFVITICHHHLRTGPADTGTAGRFDT